MKVPFAPYARYYLDYKEEIDREMQRVLGDGQMILREDVDSFEKSLARRVGSSYGVGVNSGTDALTLALRVAGIKPGDDVITVSHTFVATIEAIIKNGARPVLVDIGDDYLMDMNQVIWKMTKRTKAIISVHLSGDMCDMSQLVSITDGQQVSIIEDAAQALGATRDGFRAGGGGFAGCFSFYPAKILGTFGDAGAITTDDKDAAERLKMLRNHYMIGRIPRDTDDRRVEYGTNTRMDNLHAAILNVKLKYFEEQVKRRKEIADIYFKELENLPLVLPSRREGRVYQDFVLRVKEPTELALFLETRGIGTLGTGLTPVHRYKNLHLYGSRAHLKKTEDYTKEFIAIPCNPHMTDENAYYVAEMIDEFFKR